MKENKYDDKLFFEQYKKMARSVGGLESAGEWYALKKMLSDFKGKQVLDLGCGFGWHCRYAIEQGASRVVGIDISENMLKKARELTNSDKIEYLQKPLEEIEFPADSFDSIISSLVFHYCQSFDDICKKLSGIIKSEGNFVFSVEHPVFTAYGNQDWYYNDKGEAIHWPVDNYFIEGSRTANFLGQSITKYHRTLHSYIKSLINNGFMVEDITEPEPDPRLLKEIPELKEELRRPMMLIIAAKKK